LTFWEAKKKSYKIHVVMTQDWQVITMWQKQEFDRNETTKWSGGPLVHTDPQQIVLRPHASLSWKIFLLSRKKYIALIHIKVIK
jgi:hypothetical protein